MPRIKHHLAAAFRHWPRLSLTTAILHSGAFLAIVAGIRGLVVPSATVSEAIGWVALILALGYIGSGITTIVGAYAKSRRVEMVGLVGLAALTAIHGGVILAVTPPTADLTGLRIIGAALITLAFATARWERGLTRDDITNGIEDLHSRLNGGQDG